MRPEEELHELVERLHSSPELDFDLILDIGCGDLENLISDHGENLWPEVEHLARSDRIFQRALRFVWAYDSPEFARRKELLGERGEHWPVTLRFVVEPDDFRPEPRVSWRAVEIEAEPPAGQLSRILREIADWYDSERSDGDRGRGLAQQAWEPFFRWSQATWVLSAPGTPSRSQRTPARCGGLSKPSCGSCTRANVVGEDAYGATARPSEITEDYAYSAGSSQAVAAVEYPARSR
jgi:hypothetical protein